ncbi:hypothetical protein ACJRO7_004617 [Eucalyptus globulus]|uniref:Uncharacterized protein n=1 Tax=Eucalyptus globulus TaxID=34317 RepID=A0ABD3J0D9_EUCGL
MSPSGVETCGTMSPLDQNETSCIIQFKESLSLELMPSDERRNWEKRSIYKVRPCIANLNSKAYQPQVVSFGPYHHGKDCLHPMEEHKRRALRHFLKRSGKPLECFFKSLREVAQVLEESYEELDPNWKVGSSGDAACQFLKLLITDGCFMLEILRAGPQQVTQAEQEKDDYADDDPIFSKHGKLHVMPYIRRDMLMLENQLPMLVLDRLVAVESDGKKGDQFINDLILKFFSSPSKVTSKCLHVLDVYRKSLLPPENEVQDKLPKGSRGLIWSATELHEHGIQFKKSGTTSLKDISFERGVLKLPEISVDDTTESAYLNLIAFEHCHAGVGNEVTSYIYFMEKIIDKEGDVALLEARDIIQNGMGSDQAVAQVFNSLGKEVTLEPESSLDAVQNQVSDYCKKAWYTWGATLWNTHFESPWSITSFIAAILLFGLAIIQTVYTVLYP